MSDQQQTEREAHLYRMVMTDHVCPFGLKSQDLLKRQGYRVRDHPLTDRDQTDKFMREHGVDTTPQTFIEGRRIGGYDDLRVFFGIDPPPERQSEVSYQPVIAIFSVALLLALGMSWHQYEAFLTLQTAEWFISLSMTILAVQKLQDLESFSIMFLNYDLLARRWVRYAKIYPFGEALAGILMTAGALPWVSAPIALFIGMVGAVSIVKAVYIDKRELKCACVGGSSSVPLGFVSLTENLFMILMGIWVSVKSLVL